VFFFYIFFLSTSEDPPGATKNYSSSIFYKKAFGNAVASITARSARSRALFPTSACSEPNITSLPPTREAPISRVLRQSICANSFKTVAGTPANTSYHSCIVGVRTSKLSASFTSKRKRPTNVFVPKASNYTAR
jgi:hypothetical protein